MRELPEGWTSIELGALTSPSRPRCTPGDFAELPFIGMEQVEAHTRRLLGTIPSATMKSTAFRFFNGDVLYGRLRPYLNKVYCADFEGLCSSEFIVLPSSATFSSKYLHFYLNTEGFVTFANQLNQGDRPRVSFDQIATHHIPLPPLKEQRRIVAKLEKLLSRVDAAQARLSTIPRILKRFRQSVLAAACSGRLTTDWRVAHPNKTTFEARLAELKQARLAVVKNDSEISKIIKAFNEVEVDADADAPEGWLRLRAECICNFITKGTTPKEVTSQGDVPFLKVQHIISNKLDFLSLPCFVSKEIHDGFLKRSKVYPRDVLMNIVGPPLNKVAIVPDDFPEWNINQALAIFRPVEGVEPEYLQLLLSHEGTLEHILRETRGIVGQSNISLEQCRNLIILVPPLSEQQEIVRRVEALFKTADALEARYRKAKAHVDKLTQSILARAFRGELVTTEAELARQEGRDYESASVLLERIKQERAQQQARSKSKATTKQQRTESTRGTTTRLLG